MQGDLCAELRRQAEAILAHYPELEHRWEEIPGGIRLAFPTNSDTGFEVAVEAQESGLRVNGVGFHTHFDWQATASEAVADALGLVRDLLSPVMRVRELSAAGRPYKWELQRRDARGWRTTETTALLLWNYFGRRSEQIYQNHTLEPRAGAPGGQPTLTAQFIVEGTHEIRGKAYVFARALGAVNFRVVEGSTLGGFAIEPRLDMPRAVDANGRPRMDLFVFCLRSAADRVHIRQGSEIQLAGPPGAEGETAGTGRDR